AAGARLQRGGGRHRRRTVEAVGAVLDRAGLDRAQPVGVLVVGRQLLAADRPAPARHPVAGRHLARGQRDAAATPDLGGAGGRAPRPPGQPPPGTLPRPATPRAPSGMQPPAGIWGAPPRARRRDVDGSTASGPTDSPSYSAWLAASARVPPPASRQTVQGDP